MKIRVNSKFSEKQIETVRRCLEEIEAIKRPYWGLDDEEIEERIGDYLDELYDDYKQEAVEQNILTDKQFDELAEIIFRQGENQK